MRKKTNPITLQPGWVIYLRTSSKETQNPKNSQDRQRNEIQKHLLTGSELSVIAEYADVDSGFNIDRRSYKRMLKDAHQGKFSHVAVENAERFGRDDAEALQAIDELDALGIKVRFADYPDIDPVDADDRLLIVIRFAMARRESMKISERAQRGIHTKLRGGGHTGKAPDGYINRQEAVSGPEQSIIGRSRHWVEPDPQQFKVWREAWELLLTDKYTLEQICEELDARGYCLRSGAPFVKQRGQRTHATNSLSAVFHNWFYAGWVVSEPAGIRPKAVRGQWQPTVTTEEFEQGLAILERRTQKRYPERKHFYLLKRMAYVEIDGKLTRLSGSTSNINRPTGGNRYYCVPNSNINLPCEAIDEQVIAVLGQIQVQSEDMACLRAIYAQEVTALIPNQQSLLEQLQASLADVDEKERKMIRLYHNGKVNDDMWNDVWEELNAQRQAIQQQIQMIGTPRSQTMANLDEAVAILHQLPVLYGKLPQDKQRFLLHLLIQRVIVDRNGKLVRLELHPPFSYLVSRNRWVQWWHKMQTTASKWGGCGGECCSEYVQESCPTCSSIEHKEG